MRKSLVIQEDIDAALDRANALQNIATEAKRDLSKDEQSEWDKIMAKDSGVVAKFGIELKASQKLEEEQERLASLRAPKPSGKSPLALAKVDDKPSMPRIVYGKLNAFKDKEQAWRSGIHLAATLFESPKAAELCGRHGIDIRAVQTEGSNIAGGYLVLPEFEQTVLDLRQATGVFRQSVPFRAMASDTQIFPRRTSGLTAYAVGENAEITASTKGWDQVEIVAKKWGALAKYSSELSEDSFLNLADDLASEMAYSFSEKEDASGFVGTGTSTYHGITGAAVRINDGNHAASISGATAGNDAFNNLDLVDFENVVGALPDYPGARNAWHIHKVGFYLSMSRLAMAAGGNTAANLAGGVTLQFLGYPVIFNRHMQSGAGTIASTVVALFGDLSLACTAGERRGLTVSITRDRYFELDQIGIKGVTRWGIIAHSLGDGTDAGPIVALKTAA